MVVRPATNAVRFKVSEDEKHCNYCGDCLFGCNRDAIYSTKHHLEQLRAARNINVLFNHTVKKIMVSSQQTERLSLSNNQVVQAKNVVLCGGVVNTTVLVSDFLNHFGKWQRIYSNPVSAFAIYQPAKFQRQNSKRFGLAQLQFDGILKNKIESYTGAIYSAESVPRDMLVKSLFGPNILRQIIASVARRTFLFANVYLPVSYSNHRYRVHAMKPMTLD